MDISKIRAITNNYHDVRLLSLRAWREAGRFEDRDHGGPYVVAQEGYDPQDLKMQPDEFMLGKSGEWVRVSVFFKLPREVRQNEFIYARAEEVIAHLEQLRGAPKVVRTGMEREEQFETEDDLNRAVSAAKGA